MTTPLTPEDLLAGELAAYKRAISLPTSEVATQLTQLLPLELLADMVGVGETRALHQWSAGTRYPRGAREFRLRAVFQLAVVRVETKPWVPKAWFEGYNPLLEGTPLALVKDLTASSPDTPAIMERLAAAAKLFME